MGRFRRRRAPNPGIYLPFAVHRWNGRLHRSQPFAVEAHSLLKHRGLPGKVAINIVSQPVDLPALR